MDDLEFRKFLTGYGLTHEEYENMTEDKKNELQKKFKIQSKVGNLKTAGNGLKGIGCLIILIPVLAVLLFFIWGVITG